MRPIPGRTAAERERGPANTRERGPANTPGVRRGRHRRPRPRKVLLAAGGLALAAGVLSLVRVAPDSGVGASGTAEAEPRLDPGGRAPGGSANTSATIAAAPTALPSATSALGGRSLVPLPAGSPARSTPGSAPDTATAPPGPTAVPTVHATGTPAAPRPGGPTSPAPSGPTPGPTRATPTPAPTPTASHGTAEPRPGGVCLPVIGLCVDVLGGEGGQRAGVRGGRRGG
ncbi:hypothetical protein [Streptomyces capoamus]|uniref:hypothetical protein n=1 Tax=Streptomyces capoamus TaxID=68183 RepID=UPI001E3E12C8|nr:hypothetical protein [Streptomyces capoamus]